MYTQIVAFLGVLAVASAGHLGYHAEVYAAPVAVAPQQVIEKIVEQPVYIHKTRTVPVVHEKLVQVPVPVPIEPQVVGVKNSVLKHESFVEHTPAIHETRVNNPLIVENTRIVPSVRENVVHHPIIAPVTTGYVQRPVVSEARVAVTSQVAQPLYAQAPVAHFAPTGVIAARHHEPLLQHQAPLLRSAGLYGDSHLGLGLSGYAHHGGYARSFGLGHGYGQF